MTQDLDGFIKGNSKFLKIPENSSVEVIYKGFEIIPDRFNPGKETVSYQFTWPGSDKIIPWNKASTNVAIQMQKVSAGDKVKITRTGSGFATKYTIEPGVPF